ncbi:hypothetical protein Q7C36_001696 [Tachysurus vachellii]|uniref:Fibroblast growth factor binding protein 1 n=1 Tax=Tachysurus vachellii TaxID=175792 RepID=A0AA88TA24_TACVA|nr:fibroblast growth factor-binding protein 1 [Tachysurus vachellii]KAK2865640.1 hypothetical protein Q7C36_001696 [Tachysurus vachellii]
MRLYGNLAMFLLLAWLAPRDSSCRGKGKGRNQDGTEHGVVIKGKFTGHAKARCTWTASGDKQYTLKVTCVGVNQGNPVSVTCEYTGEPALCPSFITKPNAFWKQMSRALQQQKQHLCRDARGTVKARTCKNGPKGAHFKLVSAIKEIATTTPAVRSGLSEDASTTECTRRADHRQLAQEKCGSDWANFCNFLFHMVQSRDC